LTPRAITKAEALASSDSFDASSVNGGYTSTTDPGVQHWQPAHWACKQAFCDAVNKEDDAILGDLKGL